MLSSRRAGIQTEISHYACSLQVFMREMATGVLCTGKSWGLTDMAVSPHAHIQLKFNSPEKATRVGRGE